MQPFIPAASYVWQVAGKRVCVRLSLDVVDRLGIALRESKPAPRRSLEIGGLLLGRTSQQRNNVIVEVLNFEPLASEHAVGASYILSEADRQAFEERIADYKSAASPLKVVGFFRSHTRKDFALTMEDTFFISAYFAKASDVVLLIKPNQEGPATAGFIIRENGKIRSGAPYLSFPFDKAALASSSETIGLPEAPQPPPPRATVPTRVRIRVLSIWTGAALLLLATLTAASILFTDFSIFDRSAEPVAAAFHAPLALRFAHHGDAVRLSWDRNAPTVRQAGRGVLWIHDGAAQSKLDLDAQQLAEGSIEYRPRGRDVNFRLEVFANSLFQSESVSVVMVPQVAPAVPPAPQPAGFEVTPEVRQAKESPAPTKKRKLRAAGRRRITARKVVAKKATVKRPEAKRAGPTVAPKVE